MTTKLLFICSRNQWRSPTAERVFSRNPAYDVRSAGTSPRAKRTVNAGDISWADIVFVMESKHRDRLRASFPRAMQYKTTHVLDIEDDYGFMDEALVEIFEASVPSYLIEDPQ